MVICMNDETVLITRHIVRRVTPDHYRHRHVSHTVKREVVQYRQGRDDNTFINRRTELLQYSRHLRESAKPQLVQTPPVSQTKFSNTHHPNSQAVNAKRKRQTSRWFGNCTMSIPKLLDIPKRLNKKEKSTKNNTSIGSRVKAVTRRLQVRTVHFANDQYVELRSLTTRAK